MKGLQDVISLVPHCVNQRIHLLFVTLLVEVRGLPEAFKSSQPSSSLLRLMKTEMGGSRNLITHHIPLLTPCIDSCISLNQKYNKSITSIFSSFYLNSLTLTSHVQVQYYSIKIITSHYSIDMYNISLQKVNLI